MHKIIVIGKSGQLAQELAFIGCSDELVFLGRNDIDITSSQSINSALSLLKPTAIINASAYTAVDKAEDEKKSAFEINYSAVQKLAEFSKENNVHFVHVSTDYVFDGCKGSPYLVNDSIKPNSVYGESKAKGEAILLELIPKQSCIIRTSWVYSIYGNNFVKTMLKLMNEKSELGIIADQIGTPTWARSLALACLHAAKYNVEGIHHWTDRGVASWYDFAIAIQDIAIRKELLTKVIPINPITTEQYPTPATRPAYSVLDKSTLKQYFESIEQRHWQHQLELMLENYK